jgi:hypothetical protein
MIDGKAELLHHRRSEGSLGTRVKIDTLFPVGNPDPFPNPPATVIIPVSAMRPVALLPMPAMLAPMMLVMEFAARFTKSRMLSKLSRSQSKPEK